MNIGGYALAVMGLVPEPARLNGGGVPVWKPCLSYDWKLENINEVVALKTKMAKMNTHQS